MNDSIFGAPLDTKVSSQSARYAGPLRNGPLTSVAESEKANLGIDTKACRPHILLVGSEPSVHEPLAGYLGENDLRVTCAAEGAAMRAHLESEREAVDLVLVDLGAEDGMELARRLRDASAIPIVILGRNDEADRVMALELGADDYVTKPFSCRELLARVRAILRRRHPAQRKRPLEGVRGYRFGGCELNVRTRQLACPDGRRVALSNGEFSLLVVLLRAGPHVLSRDKLLDLSRVHGDEVYERAVDVQILRLRRKLGEQSSEPRYILAVRGAGYRIGVPVQVIY